MHEARSRFKYDGNDIKNLFTCCKRWNLAEKKIHFFLFAVVSITLNDSLFVPQTATPSPLKEPPPKPKLAPKPTSPPQEEKASSMAVVEQALERMLMKSPSRRDSYSDSTDEEDEEDEEEDEEGFGPASQNESTWEMDDTIRSAYANAGQAADRAEANRRSGQGFFQEI